jgi:DNA polymerase/3'-5' exonuclease PolX
MLSLCERYRIDYRIRRYIPKDFRRENYEIAQKLLDKAYVCQITGKPWSNIFWAGQNINNLKESIRRIAQRGELQSIRNVNPSIEEYISKELKHMQGKSNMHLLKIDCQIEE